MLKLKYRNAIADAVADLGKPEEIGQLFLGSKSICTHKWLNREGVASGRGEGEWKGEGSTGGAGWCSESSASPGAGEKTEDRQPGA